MRSLLAFDLGGILTVRAGLLANSKLVIPKSKISLNLICVKQLQNL